MDNATEDALLGGSQEAAAAAAGGSAALIAEESRPRETAQGAAAASQGAAAIEEESRPRETAQGAAGAALIEEESRPRETAQGAAGASQAAAAAALIEEESRPRQIVQEGPQDKDVPLVNGEPSQEEPGEKDKDHEAKDDDEWEDILGSGQIKKKLFMYTGDITVDRGVTYLAKPNAKGQVIRKAENGHRPGQNAVCEINLIGRLEDGSEVERYENLKVDLGDVEVVQGIDLALPLMEVGEVALVEVGPRFAYGSLGKEPEIPPNARMFYSVELLAAEDTPELEALPISTRKAIGIRKRERGNWWFSRQEYNFAIHCYRRAVEYLDDVTEGFSSDNRDEGQNLDDELQDLLENRLKVYNNLAAAQMKIKVYDAALTSVENVLRCQPQNVKALFRKGKILAAKGDTSGAVSVLTAARRLEPDNAVIRQELLRCTSLLRQDTDLEKNLYKKMLGQQAKSHPESPTRHHSKSRGVTWGLVCGSIVAVLVGALAFRYKFP